jgi:hypothetical protein
MSGLAGAGESAFLIQTSLWQGQYFSLTTVWQGRYLVHLGVVLNT